MRACCHVEMQIYKEKTLLQGFRIFLIRQNQFLKDEYKKKALRFKQDFLYCKGKTKTYEGVVQM